MLARTALVASLLLAAPGLAEAQSRWTHGYGQGIHEASIRNAGGASFSVSCPDGSPTARPGLLITFEELTGGQDVEAVPASLVVDGRTINWRLDRRVLDQNQVVFDWDAAGPETEAQLAALVRSLRNGRRLTVSIPTQNVSEVFSLAGSSAALQSCAGPY